MAISDSLSVSYEKAFNSDQVSAFGGIIGCNTEVDAATAELMSSLFIEAIIAPSFSDDAFQILAQKSSLRLVELPNFFEQDHSFQIRYVQGGILAQTPDQVVMNEDAIQVVTNRAPEAHESRDLKFAFAICKHVKSNAIVLVKNGQTIGVGAGQMSRVESVEIALKKASNNVNGAVCASDAFFPFKDSIEHLAAHGITAIVQPGGSKRDQESIDACNENDMTMVFSGIRHFKH